MTVPANSLGGKKGVLVIHPGALGDVLLARPALHALRGQFSNHEIALLSANAAGSLLCDCGEVDRTFPLEEMYLSQLFAGYGTIGDAFRRWLMQCQVGVGWLRDTEGALTDSLRAAGVGSINLQSPFFSDLSAIHQADRYFEAIGMEWIGQEFIHSLVLPAERATQGQRILKACNWNGRSPLVLLHPGSGSLHKCVEAWRLAKVIEWLIEAGTAPMLLEGPADERQVAKVRSSLTVSVPVIRELSLSIVAGVLAHAALYVGHDSGMTHLAVALSIPTVAYFGPTQATRWAPRGPMVSVISGRPCVCAGWSNVETCHDKFCLQIPVEDMIEACRNQLLRHS